MFEAVSILEGIGPAVWLGILWAIVVIPVVIHRIFRRPAWEGWFVEYEGRRYSIKKVSDGLVTLDRPFDTIPPPEDEFLLIHPDSMRFCHICGTDTQNEDESCDPELHA